MPLKLNFVITASSIDFRFFSIWYNVNIYMVLTQKIIGEPINCGIFL